LQFIRGEKKYRKEAEKCKNELGGEYLDEYCKLTPDLNTILYKFFHAKVICLGLAYCILALYYFSHIVLLNICNKV
jgi:hypothetical protein